MKSKAKQPQYAMQEPKEAEVYSSYSCLTSEQDGVSGHCHGPASLFFQEGHSVFMYISFRYALHFNGTN
jgi:hypothetical protein